MRKLTLNPDHLAVASFDPHPLALQAPIIAVGGYSQDMKECDSPLCGPTYWEGCQLTVD